MFNTGKNTTIHIDRIYNLQRITLACISCNMYSLPTTTKLIYIDTAKIKTVTLIINGNTRLANMPVDLLLQIYRKESEINFLPRYLPIFISNFIEYETKIHFLEIQFEEYEGVSNVSLYIKLPVN